MKTKIPFVLALLSGASLTFAYAPFNLWYIAPIALIIAIRQLAMVKRERAFFTGWLFGLGWFGAGVSWVHVSIADFGGLPLAASVGMMFLLCAYLALFPAISFYLTKRFASVAAWPLLLPACWFVAEWFRSWFLSGFPWLSLGYSQLHSPLAGWLPIVGETGVTLLIVMLSTSLAISIQRTGRTTTFIMPVLLTLTLGISGLVLNQVDWTQRHKPYSIAMVQGNIAQSLRWAPEHDGPTMEKYLSLTDPLWQNDLIIWPEAAIPKIEPLAQDYIAYVDRLAGQNNTSLVTGIVNFNLETDEAWNNIIVLGNKERHDNVGQYRYFHGNRYAKHHLLPVGEVVPFEDWLRPLAPIFDLPMSSFARGDYQQTNLVANGIHLAPSLCFEIAFPRLLNANLHNDTDFIITVSNDAWFGASHGPDQHLEIAQVRAKEFGIPVLRATNNGITAFIDEKGDLISRLPQFEAGSLTATLYSTRGLTPYRRFGDTFGWVATLLLLVGYRYISRR